MGHISTSFSGKKDFFVATYNYTVDEVFESKRHIQSLQKWATTIWAAALAFSIQQRFTDLKIALILFAIVCSFGVLNIFLNAMNERLIKIVTGMETYLVETSGTSLSVEKRTLWDIIAVPILEKKKVRIYLWEAFLNWKESVFYYILLGITTVISILLFIS
jgi:hypothetical protein